MLLSERWVEFADRHRWALLAVCALLAVAGTIGTVRLYSDLRPDLSELLPTQSRSAVDLREVTQRAGGFSQLTVVLHGTDPGTLQLFADDLADALDQAPKDLVKYVEYKLDDEAQAFFKQRLLLFPSKAELETLRDTLAARVRWEEANARGAAAGAAPDVEALLRKMAGERGEQLGKFPTGYYQGEVDGPGGVKTPILAMLVRLAGDPNDFSKVEALDDVVKTKVAKLDPSSYDPKLEVAYGGYVTSTVREHDALAEDLVLATILVVFAVALSVWIYNRTWKALVAIGVPLLSGTMVTFGVGELAVGHLNSNTAFLGSIVVGNGINVGLIFFARYLEERRRGGAPLDAMKIAVRETWLGTLTAALAAGVAYASLLATDFRGFNQFGLIGGVGMALSWLSAFVMIPPLVLAWERRKPLVRPGQVAVRPLFTKVVSHVIERHPKYTVAASVVLTVASLFFIQRFARDPIEFDFKQLRDQSALEEGGPSWWDARVDALFGTRLTPTALLADSEEDARAIAKAIEAHRVRTPGSTIGGVVSVEALVPEGQAEKLPVIGEIRALLTPENLSFLPPHHRMAIEQVIPPADLAPFASKDLPEAARRQITEVDGRIGTPVLVHPSTRVDTWNGRDVLQFAEELRGIELPRAGVPTASSLLVFADVLHAIAADGPRATLYSIAGVVVLVVVAFGFGRRNL
ncbi:MAG TPA: MMPL family transporter, partial [Anaeromyxobacteraceae bacterium]|nr:MMPL family transporter [Anaeromyxobacteraceae bacterium]